ncbi:MAG: hypothetical protein Tsb009_13040 [Planctomycetaceae bacterium]
MNPLIELKSLTDLFPDDPPLIEKAEHVPKDLLPSAYRTMLAHDKHMTVTMEGYHGCKVNVRILDRHQAGDIYTRKILLLKSETDEPVQFGIVRFDFQYVTATVRNAIVKGEAPLGRVLINHNVLRHVDLGALLRITAGKSLAKYLNMKAGDVTYGRLATIFCDGHPAVDLLEISGPLPEE